MEAHPVPQNVTSFEFHLIGDMTVKQFAYLAAGLASGYLTYIFVATKAPFIGFPLVILFVGVGAAFAFLPISERPLDHWLAAFFKAVFQPTQLKYQSPILKKDNPLFKKRLEIYFNTVQTVNQSAKQERRNISSLLGSQPVPVPQAPITPPTKPTPQSPIQSQLPQPFNPTQGQRSSTPPAQPVKPAANKEAVLPIVDLKEQPSEKDTLPSPQELKKTVELAKQATVLQAEIIKTEQELGKIKYEAAQPGVDPKKFTNQFQTVVNTLQQLNTQESAVSHELAVLSKTNAPVVTIPMNQIKSIPTLSLTTTPNIINGIITDTQGNYVEGAIIVAHDKQGLPVRALKSNKLGQFIAATPLPDGIYTVTTEKEHLFFDGIQIELKGEVLSPVHIEAKKPERAMA